MNKYIWLSLAAAPIVCLSSCSSPEQAGSTDVITTIKQLTELMNNSKSATTPQVVAGVHAIITKAAPSIIESFSAMTDEQKVAAIKAIAESPELAALMEAASSMQASPAVTSVMPAFMNDRAAAKVVEELPLETKMQTVDIAAAVIKIALAIGVDQESMRNSLMRAF